ncbi:MAG: homocysteine S-methyltransferase family protein [Bacteroidota bacterium]|nr:homocysteine S-methyltransferase family protein [Bacteroidota bacterium]MDP4204632.1 homocysteine S-methyltransferase family protein [Bacteroidota bacterium]
MNKIRDSYKDYSENILYGGLLGCRGDAYSSKDALSIEESYKFHRNQTMQFEKENIDFLFAGIMPEINEAIGMAQAMSDTEIVLKNTHTTSGKDFPLVVCDSILLKLYS